MFKIETFYEKCDLKFNIIQDQYLWFEFLAKYDLETY